MVSIRSFILPSFQAFALVVRTLSIPRSTPVPTVTLDYGTFQGFNSAGDTESFLGMPFAQPPVGKRRFNKPVAPLPFDGVRNTTWFGDACSQQPTLGSNETFPEYPGLAGVTQYIGELLPSSLVTDSSEDCLYLNVVRPAGVSTGANLPVIIFIYGGAFENGDASGYNGTHIVSRSLGLKSPVLFVSFNYRLNAFGFLGGKEVQAAGLGNLGLLDQRFALEWVQQYIQLFGGNPQKVILWGESAGASSVMYQMVAYDGQLDGLFHGAVMESGSASPVHGITFPQAQNNYDFLVAQTNCTDANDTLDCLRQAPYELIHDAVLQTAPLLSYRALNTSWRPLIDGVVLKQSIRQSLRQGKYARLPAILGDVDDEGTLFSLFSANVVNKHTFANYMQTNFLVGVSDAVINKVTRLYPKDLSLGSPYDTGDNNTLTPEYKRIASFQGDFYFQVPRRYALRYLSRTQNVWSFLWKRYKFVPGIGSFHGSDLQEFYDLTGSPDWVGTDALVNLAYRLDPNVPHGGYPSGAVSSQLSDVFWPPYDRRSPQLLTFEDMNVLAITNDTYRAKQIAFLSQVQDLMGL